MLFRSHPEFRTHGVGKCEWDGAIWPFASAQTLTAMANFMNNYPQTVLSDSVYFRQMELYVNHSIIVVVPILVNIWMR